MIVKYVRIIDKNPFMDWRLREGERYEIVGEVDDYYFIWAGRQIAFPKATEFEYHIEEEYKEDEQ